MATAADRWPFDPDSGPVRPSTPGAVVDRVLVVIDFRGGNDGLSLLAPVADGRYHDLRPSLAIAEEDALWLDDEVGLHPAMARLRERPLITVEGVGPVAGDLSHFAMTERWERGDAAGSYAPHTGFLGRLTDAPTTAARWSAFRCRATPTTSPTREAATLALDGLDDLWFFEPTDWAPAAAFRQGIERFVRTDDAGPVADAYERLLALSTELASRDEEENNWEDPMFSEGGDLGAKLRPQRR
ncbi:MAG: hypothetical protein R2710_15925 [Acidimicrobiales bacterium]